ncbi:MAG TPA: GNAT family N-acetyltransferase [Acidimicrobiales bacterium]|nr:GNAT family N-acetyltransferase [Acidimicrobiales bacterium]
MGHRITNHDPRLDSDAQLSELAGFENRLAQEMFPEDPPTPVEAIIALERAVPERYRRWSLRARDEASGELVGTASAGIDPDHDDNPDMLRMSVQVLPGYRRRGVGRALLGGLAEIAQSEGRTRLVSSVHQRCPAGEAFARTAGAEVKSRLHLNRLLMPEVDRDLMDGWMADADSETYELLIWERPIPEQHLADFVQLYLVMNAMPHDDLQRNDFTLTPEQWRESEEIQAAFGTEDWTMVVRRRSDGALAGFHHLTLYSFDPTVAWIDSTGVSEEHRGHGLGKWLKAAMTLRLLEHHPELREIRTGNHDSNAAMLAINRQMGYREFIATAACEIGTGTALAWTGSSRVTAGEAAS